MIKLSIKGKKVFIDPGHGGTSSQGIALCKSYNVGTSGKLSGSEKSSVLTIGNSLKSYLESAGAVVKMSRTSDIAVCLGERAKMANDWKADIFISLHHNGNDNSSVNGISAHWYKSTDKSLAEKIAPRIVEYTGLKTWGSTGVRNDNFQVLRETNMPAVLLELGFMTNPTDDAFIAEYEHKLDFCAGILKGVQDYYS